MSTEQVSGNENRYTDHNTFHDQPQQNGNLHDQQNGGDSGDSDHAEKGEDAPPTPVGFFHSSLDHVRKEVFWKWCLTTLVLCVFILGILSICEYLTITTKAQITH